MEEDDSKDGCSDLKMFIFLELCDVQHSSNFFLNCADVKIE